MNSKAAEVLYACVGDLAELQDKGTLVDVCCGTGTMKKIMFSCALKGIERPARRSLTSTKKKIMRSA